MALTQVRNSPFEGLRQKGGQGELEKSSWSRARLCRAWRAWSRSLDLIPKPLQS